MLISVSNAFIFLSRVYKCFAAFLNIETLSQCTKYQGKTIFYKYQLSLLLLLNINVEQTVSLICIWQVQLNCLLSNLFLKLALRHQHLVQFENVGTPFYSWWGSNVTGTIHLSYYWCCLVFRVSFCSVYEFIWNDQLLFNLFIFISF